jgi:uncharacterized repeat protein (TIGR03803 family)
MKLKLFALTSAILLLSGAAMAAGPRHTTIYTFTGLGDGGDPWSGLTLDSTGALYGTGSFGGNYDSCDEGGACGVVFMLTPPAQNGGAWTETAIYDFQYQDPFPPTSNVVFDSSGNLYGTTGGADSTLYQLTESGGTWSLNPVWGPGNYGKVSPPIFDKQGNLYLTSELTSTLEMARGEATEGMVLELSPQSNGTWAETTLYAFTGGSDGGGPTGGVIADSSGNLYGTTLGGGSSSECGTVFELSPQKNGGWTETVLHVFSGSDGCGPDAGLVRDGEGNLYGTTYNGGVGVCNNQCGVVFEVSPPAVKGGDWTESTLHSFDNKDGANPFAALAIDSTGVLYGTTVNGGNGPCEPTGIGCGTVFQLTPPSQPGGAWAHVFYSFQGPEGSEPRGNVVLSKGVLYGTTVNGGHTGYGTVFQFTR